MRHSQMFEELGFSEKETAVYVALLAADSATVTDIAETAEINRTTCYEVLRVLLHRGLISKCKKKKKTYFQAGDPRRLLTYLEREKEEKIKMIDEQKRKVEEVMPELLSQLEPKSTKPKVAFYEGEKGMREAYEDTLTAKRKEILGYANVETMHQGLPHFFPEYYARRTKVGIRIAAIMPKNAPSQHRARKDKEELRETLFLAEEQMTFSPEVNIYDNKMLIASWKEKMAIIIESKELVDLQKLIHRLLWKALKKEQK